MRKINFTKPKKRLAAVVSGVLAVIVLLNAIPAIQTFAVFDESKAVRFSTYKRSHNIENSVLFIGTHLIHMQAMTDELYTKAVDSQSDSGQNEIYYKSELADGTWYDITDASGLSDITTGTPINESELNDLFVTHYTGADGITKDARSGSSVCIFDDPDPYDLLKLKELETLRMIRSDKYGEEESGLHKYIYQALKSFFAKDVQNDKTRDCDRALKSLQKCYEAYCAVGMEEDAQVIMSLMESVDATRRAEVFSQLSEDHENEIVTMTYGFFGSFSYVIDRSSLLSKLTKTVTGDYYNSGSYDDEEFIADEMLVEAVMNALNSCAESYTSYSGKMLAEGGSSIRSYIFTQSQALVQKCENNATIATDSSIAEIVNNIKYAMNIEKSIVGDADKELALLDNEFVPKASDAYGNAMHAGASQEYQAAVAANRSDTAKKAILDNDMTNLEVARSELETMITAKKERMSSSDALNYVYERITWTYDQQNDIKADDFAASAKESATAHIDWLMKVAQQIVDGDASLMSELERLQALLDEYLVKQQEALDDGNLELAAQYAALAQDTSDKIAAEQARLNDILNSDTASEADKAAARVALGESGLLSDIDKLLRDALSALNNSYLDQLKSLMDMLASLGAENALNSLKDALKDSSLSDSDKNKMSDALDAALDASKKSSLHDKANASGIGSGNGDGSGSGTGSGTGDGSGTGTGTGSGNGDGSGSGTGSGDGSGTGTGSGSGSGSGTGSSDTDPTKMSEQALLNAIEQILGGSFDELDAEGRIAVAAALDRLYDNYSNVNARKLAKQFITICVSERNPYAYTKLKNQSDTEYISLATIGTKPVSSYRYVYSDSRQEATMTYGARSYQFRVGAKVVGMSDGTEQEIKKYKVEFQNTPYIDEETAKTYFNCEAEYIIDTDYSACLTKQVKEKADMLYEALTGQD